MDSQITVFCGEKWFLMVKESSFHKTCVVTVYIELSVLFFIILRAVKSGYCCLTGGRLSLYLFRLTLLVSITDHRMCFDSHGL